MTIIIIKEMGRSERKRTAFFIPLILDKEQGEFTKKQNRQSTSAMLAVRQCSTIWAKNIKERPPAKAGGEGGI